MKTDIFCRHLTIKLIKKAVEHTEHLFLTESDDSKGFDLICDCFTTVLGFVDHAMLSLVSLVLEIVQCTR